VMGIAYELFSKTKMDVIEKSLSFSESFRTVFSDRLEKLTEAQLISVSAVFDLEVSTLEKSFNALLEKQKQKDSIDLETAKELSLANVRVNCFKQLMPLAKPLLTE